VSVIRTSTNTVVDTIPVGDLPLGVAVTPDCSRVYVSNHEDDTVSVIRIATDTVVDTIPVGDGPQGVAIGPLDERIPTRLTLRAERDRKDTVADGLTLTARLTAAGEPLEGETITFATDSTPLCAVTTDDQGEATCEVGAARAKGTGTCYTAAFAGDDTYVPSSATLCTRLDDGPDDLSFMPMTGSGSITPARAGA
jgi:YVTN family beta-propeller protein